MAYVLTVMCPVFVGAFLACLNETKDRTPERPAPRAVSRCAPLAPETDLKWWTRK